MNCTTCSFCTSDVDLLHRIHGPIYVQNIKRQYVETKQLIVKYNKTHFQNQSCLFMSN